MVDYSYQNTAADKILEMALSERYIATILAAAPSSGKSTIIINILNKLFSINPNYRAVIFTHNLNNLKDQMLEGFSEGYVNPNFTYGSIGENVQVQVGVVASGSKVFGNVDIVVFDEAHQYYLENMAEAVLSTLKPKYVIGMTGTPSYFNSFNSFNVQKKFGVHYISAEELVDLGVFSTVLVDVVNGEDLESRLNNSLKRAASHGMDLSKIIVATKDQMEANMIGYLLSKQGRKVAVSTSSVDPKNERLGGYKQGRYDTLVIVRKAILGFSDTLTTGLIDLQCSCNIDNRYQLFARVLRKHPKNIKKFYISAVISKNNNKEILILKESLSIMKKQVFKTYTI